MFSLVGDGGELVFSSCRCSMVELEGRSKCRVHKVHISHEFTACVRGADRLRMVEEQIRQLAAKHSLDGGDAFALLQLLQEQTTPILSLRSTGSSNASSSDHLPAVTTDEGDRVSRIEGLRGKGRTESGRGRNVCRGVSPKKTLFDSGESVGDAARALDVNSLVEFPPMQPPATITTRLPTSVLFYWHTLSISNFCL